MKKEILVLSRKKLPKQFLQLENDFSISTQRDILKGYKSVLTSPPDIVLLNLESVFERTHFLSLLAILPETEDIPIVDISEDESCMLDDGDAQICSKADYKEIKTYINKVIKGSKFTKLKKLSLNIIKPTSGQIKDISTEILDKMVLSSSVSDDFKRLASGMIFDDVLAEAIFKIMDKYFHYEAAGIFFNDSDETKSNVLNMSFPQKNIAMETIEDLSNSFFDEIEKYKTVNEVRCYLINGGVDEKNGLTLEDLPAVVVLPIYDDGTLYGGLVAAFKDTPDAYNHKALEVITHELEILLKLKYFINEQRNNAVYDIKTGLFNRQEFEADLDKEFHRARRYIYNFTLAMLDIDYLSEINEKYGRDFGDFVIKELGGLLKKIFRRTDTIYRYGGEEMIVLLPSTPITKAVIPIERLRAQISNHVFEKDGIKTNITVSIGLCANYSRFTTPEQLLDAVGKSLVRAKEGGRNKVDLFE